MQPVQIHKGKTPRRRHYIAEWAEKLGKTPSDIIYATGADKSLVSRWLNGVLPREGYLEQIAALFEVKRDALFREPDESEDDWLTTFFHDKSEEEKVRAKQMLELMFGKKSGTDG